MLWRGPLEMLGRRPAAARGATIFALGLLAGCGGSAPPGPVTFSADIAPIIFRECAGCHHETGSAPFGLVDYDEVRGRARQIAEVTRSRSMPPWLPEPGYGEFVGERRLTDPEIALIGRWVDEGAVEGDPLELPPGPGFTGDWRLGEPDLVVTAPEPYTVPADGPDAFRNLVIPSPVSGTRYVKTVELRWGNQAVVHHAIMRVDSTRSSRQPDEEGTGGGFDGMDIGQAVPPDGHLMRWTPGTAPLPGIDGAAWRLEPGTDLVLQLHVSPSGAPEVLQPALGFYFAEGPTPGLPLHLVRLDADHALDIPPGDTSFAVTDSVVLPVDVDVLAVYPHARFLARTMEGWAELPDGTERWLLRIDEWDLTWQEVYRYATPIALPAGTRVGMRFSYDNSLNNPRNPSVPPRRVTAGTRLSDEVAHMQFQVRPRSASDLARLMEAR